MALTFEERRRRRMCERKYLYRNLRAAQMAVETLRAKGDNVHVYKCEYVSKGHRHFHVGHKNRYEPFITQEESTNG